MKKKNSIRNPHSMRMVARRAVVMLIVVLTFSTGINAQAVMRPAAGQASTGVKGYVFRADGMGDHNLIVVTDENLTTIYGEYVLRGQNRRYEIPNLPTGVKLLVHFLFHPSVWSTEEFVITSGWVEKNLDVNVQSYGGQALNERLGIISVFGHYSGIYLQGQQMERRHALYQRIHYLRLIGNWQLHGRTAGTQYGTLKFDGGGIFRFNADGTGTAPLGDRFFWKCQYKKVGNRRNSPSTLVITMSQNSNFSEAGDIQATILYDGNNYQMIWDDSSRFTKIN